MIHMDFNERPFLVIWETTRACDLVCAHCRAEAMPFPAEGELTTMEGFDLIRQVAELGAPILVFSGGDPLKRRDIEELIHEAASRQLRTGVIPAVTPNLTPERMRGLRDCGLDQIAFSLDAADAETHDAFRGVPGVFEHTLRRVTEAHALGLNVQINTLLNVHNRGQIRPLIRLMENLPIVFWEVFFLVPTGRGDALPLLEASEFEELFESLYALSRSASFIVKVTEAPHYRRFVCEKEEMARGNCLLDPALLPEVLIRTQGPPEGRASPFGGPGGSIGQAPQGVNAGKGFAFVSYRGDVFPSGFLPLAAGNVRERALGEIYREAPLFRELRDTSKLKGRCGACRFRDICGGSRSRAYAVTGDYLAEDPACSYEPAGRPKGEPRHSAGTRCATA